MKRKIILTLIMSAMLLAGCEKNTELVDDIQTTAATSAPQAVQEVQNAAEPAKTDAETSYILGGVTESTESAENTKTAEIKEKHTAEISWKIFDYGSLNPVVEGTEYTSGYFFIKDNIFCAYYNIVSDDRSSSVYQLRFYDIAENKFLALIDVPDNYEMVELIEESGDTLCRVMLYNSVFDEESGVYNTESAVMTVHDDLSYDISKSDSQPYSPIECCGHNIAERNPDIIDADSGEVLIAGKKAENDKDFSGTWQMYYFPIDENRFVYRTGGYERLPGFGIYDFSTGTAADVPDFKDLIPLGVHNGKIYSVKTAWDGIGTELYITDTETLETGFFTDCPAELEMNDYVEYKMSESGKYIAVKYLPFADTEAPAVLYVIDPDTKEFFKENIPDGFKYYTIERTAKDLVLNTLSSEMVLIAEIDV